MTELQRTSNLATSRSAGRLRLFRLLPVALPLALLALCEWMAGPPAPLLRNRGPIETDGMVELLEEKKPQLVLLGNSMLGKGISGPQLERLTGLRITKRAPGGSGSALWYLLMKNAILRAEHRPQVVVLFFRDFFITHPTFRVEGNYLRAIDRFGGEEEPLLDRLAYHHELNPVEFALSRHLGLYQRRSELKGDVEGLVRRLSASLVGADGEEAEAALERQFADDRMQEELLTRAQLAAEEGERPRRWDFDRQVGNSFLPPIVELAREADIQLVLVRVRKRRDAEGRRRHSVRTAYTEALSEYLELNGIPFFDFSNEERLQIEHFAIGDHLNEQGRALFTELLAGRLEEVIAPRSERATESAEP